MRAIEVMLRLIRTEVCGVALQGDEVEALASWLQSEDAGEQLYRLAKHHDMVHIVAEALEKYGLPLNDASLSAKLKKQRMLAVFRYEGITYEYERICFALGGTEIPYMPLKGSVIRALYPEAWMRTSCDIDILVREEDLSRAVDCLAEQLGYQKGREGTHDVSLYAPGDVHLELHYSLNESGFRMIDTLTDIWTYARPSEREPYCYEMTDEAFYFHHVTHMAKHFDYGGCGVRPFLDLWLLERRVPHDSDARDALLEKEGFLSFANTVRQLAEVWFDGKPHTALTERVEHFILEGGAYGNVENCVAVKQLRKGGKLRYLLSRIFLPTRLLSVCYPALKKRKWLLPYYHVCRWCRIIFKGGLRHSVRELSVNRNISKEEAQSTAQFLKEIGL